MKKLTNYTPGLRGVTLLPETKDGTHEIAWIEPGQSITVDPKRIVEPLPDLGEKPGAVDTSETEALAAENAELREQVTLQAKQIESLQADLEKATKPAK